MKEKLNHYLPDLKECWMLVLVLLIAGTVLQSIFQLIVLRYWPEQEWLTKAVSYVLMFLPLLGVIGYRCHASLADPEQSPSIAFSSKLQSQLPLPVFYLILGCSIPCLSLLSEAMIAWMPAPAWFTQLMQQLTGGNLWINLLSVAVLAPLLEEFFCRGIVMRGLLHHTSPVRAILWSSFIFAVIHLNPWQAVPAFVMGCFFGWVYYRTHSLWTSIFLHAVNNGLCVLIPHWFTGGQADVSWMELLPSSLPQAGYYALASALLLVLIYLIHHYTKPLEQTSHESK